MALDLNTGKILWSRQMTPGDAWTSACRLPDKTNCPDETAPDWDFASSPILVTLASGKRALIAGQKSGVVHALDPDNNGKILWQVPVGKGHAISGIQWGSAADQSSVYVAIADLERVRLPFDEAGLAASGIIGETDADPKTGGGIVALRLDNGERLWFTPPPSCGDRRPCSPAQSAAVSAIAGVAFSGSVDGVPAKGGAINGPGPVIVDGMVFFNSGYSMPGGAPGNVLLAFSVDGK